MGLRLEVFRRTDEARQAETQLEGKMQAIYSSDGSAVKLYGDYSPHPVVAMADLVVTLGGAENTFHTLKSAATCGMLPWHGSEAHPLTLRDWRYTQDNIQRGERFWRWFDLEFGHVKRDTGYDYMRGYGFQIAEAITLVNAHDEPVFVIGLD